MAKLKKDIKEIKFKFIVLGDMKRKTVLIILLLCVSEILTRLT